MKRYVAKKYIVLGANNKQFVIGQELPADTDSATIEQLLEDNLIEEVQDESIADLIEKLIIEKVSDAPRTSRKSKKEILTNV